MEDSSNGTDVASAAFPHFRFLLIISLSYLHPCPSDLWVRVVSLAVTRRHTYDLLRGKEACMFNRYHTIDIAVGVGMCAIFFGALLFFVAASGTYQAALPQSSYSGQPMGLQSGMTWLQPALGQAIVNQILSERRADRAIALAVSDWNRTTLAYDEFMSRPDGPLGAVMRYAVAAPADHAARVQVVMGQAIFNSTLRGVKSGLLSADLAQSAFNLDMIRTIQIRGLLLHHQFTSNWQTTLGHRIVEAAQDNWRQAVAFQERLGTAVVHVAQVQMQSEQIRAMQQETLGSFVFAAIRPEPPAVHPVSASVIASIPTATAVASTEPASWPEIPLSYLLVAVCMLAMVFLMGLSLADRGRNEKELARIRHDASRWVYRTAS